jgi:hypothetical protein
MFIKPNKRSSTFKKFSKHETIQFSVNNRFLLQKRKKQTPLDNDESSALHSPSLLSSNPTNLNDSASTPSHNNLPPPASGKEQHYNYRIILTGMLYFLDYTSVFN